jgi:hypothetical protein
MAMAGGMNGSRLTAKFTMEIEGEMSKREVARAAVGGVGDETFVELDEGRRGLSFDGMGVVNISACPMVHDVSSVIPVCGSWVAIAGFMMAFFTFHWVH